MAKNNINNTNAYAIQEQELFGLFQQALAKDGHITADSIWSIWHTGTTGISRAFLVRKLAPFFRKMAKHGYIKKEKTFKLSVRTSKPLPVWIRCK